VQEVIQSASGPRNAETFARLCDLIEERIGERAKMEAVDQLDPAVAAAWAGLWQTVRGRRLELEALNLDKGAFLVSTFSDMERIATIN
jgi:DNA polymerase-3 subunit delta'